MKLHALIALGALAACVPAIAAHKTTDVNATSAPLQPIEEIHARQGVASIYVLPFRFKKIIVGNPQVADVSPLTDKSLLVEAHKTGMTNLILLDDMENPISEIAISVDAPIGIVTMHNMANINSSMSYQCSPTGCEYVGATTAAEPMPLPRGWSNQSINMPQGTTAIPQAPQ